MGYYRIGCEPQLALILPPILSLKTYAKYYNHEFTEIGDDMLKRLNYIATKTSLLWTCCRCPSKRPGHWRQIETVLTSVFVQVTSTKRFSTKFEANLSTCTSAMHQTNSMAASVICQKMRIGVAILTMNKQQRLLKHILTLKTCPEPSK